VDRVEPQRAIETAGDVGTYASQRTARKQEADAQGDKTRASGAERRNGRAEGREQGGEQIGDLMHNAKR